MPELPDVVVYLDRLRALVGGKVLERVRVASPFVVRSYDPPISALHGRRLSDFSRIGKRLVLGFGDDLFLVIHLMIAGRLHMKDAGAPIPKRLGLAAFDFEGRTLLFAEAGTKKRASLHVVRGEDALDAFSRGGLEPLSSTLEEFAAALASENHTLKRSLTDPRLFSGIGNAYSDEILFDARLSPIKLTSRLTPEEVERLHESTRNVLVEWTERLRAEAGEGFPEKVTAFRPEMNVHGRYGEPCRVCGTKIQRIRHASNEVNYCARCQTEGKVIADRGLSRLLGKDWPRSIEELEEFEAKKVTPGAAPVAKSPARKKAARSR
jgi:formamidopyrimidine-DNA glycosylase